MEDCMIAENMVGMVKNSSVIRQMFEEGNRLAKLYGAENVYDFSLGNPNVPVPVLWQPQQNVAMNSQSSRKKHNKPFLHIQHIQM